MGIVRDMVLSFLSFFLRVMGVVRSCREEGGDLEGEESVCEG